MRRKRYRPPVPIVKDTAELMQLVDRLIARGAINPVTPAADPPRDEVVTDG